MGDIIKFPGSTSLDLPSEWVLDAAKELSLKHCIVVGEQQDGDYYFASTTIEGPLNIWLVEKFKKFLLTHIP